MRKSKGRMDHLAVPIFNGPASPAKMNETRFELKQIYSPLPVRDFHNNPHSLVLARERNHPHDLCGIMCRFKISPPKLLCELEQGSFRLAPNEDNFARLRVCIPKCNWVDWDGHIERSWSCGDRIVLSSRTHIHIPKVPWAGLGADWREMWGIHGNRNVNNQWQYIPMQHRSWSKSSFNGLHSEWGDTCITSPYVYVRKSCFYIQDLPKNLVAVTQKLSTVGVSLLMSVTSVTKNQMASNMSNMKL